MSNLGCVAGAQPRVPMTLVQQQSYELAARFIDRSESTSHLLFVLVILRREPSWSGWMVVNEPQNKAFGNAAVVERLQPCFVEVNVRRRAVDNPLIRHG